MTAGPTPDELLSAYLDDELTAAERSEVEDWLAADPARREQLDGLAAVRRQVRELPWLEMPAELSGATSPLLSRRHSAAARSRRRSNVVAVLSASMAVVVLAGALVLGGGRPAQATDVPVEEVVDIHQDGPWDGSRVVDDVTAPASVGGHRLVAVTHHGRLVGMHYLGPDGESTVSIFEAAGRVRWSSLGDGRWGEIDGDRMWSGTDDGYEVVVVQRRGRVYVVVSEPGHAVAISKEMPGEGEPSLWGRVTRRCHDTLQLFSGR